MATQKIPEVEAEVRDRVGSRLAQRIRKDGRLPAVIYGHKQQPLHVSLDHRHVSDLLHRNTHLIEIVVGSQTPEPCLIKDVQWDHLGSAIVHLDLARVDLAEKVTVSVSLELVGDAVGLKEAHTILQRSVNEITIECRASDIPDKLQADISELNVGDTLTVAQLQLPAGITTTLGPETVVAMVSIVNVEPEEEEGVTADAIEPEVIGGAQEQKGTEDEAGKTG